MFGCGADDGGTAATTTTAFPRVAAAGTERKAIVDAYNSHWEPSYRYLNADGGEEPVGNYFAGERRDDLSGQVASYAGRQLEGRGSPDSRIWSVLVDGDRAVVVDGQIDGSLAVDRDTSSLVIPPSIPQLVRAQLTRDDSGAGPTARPPSPAPGLRRSPRASRQRHGPSC